MQNHLITEILGLEDVVLKKTLRSDIDMKFFIETKPNHRSAPLAAGQLPGFMITGCRRFETFPFS